MSNEENVVTIDVHVTGGGITRQGFGIDLILSNTGNAWATPELTRTYATLAGFVVDFPEDTPEFLAATALFSQPIKPEAVMVGKGTHYPQMTKTIAISVVANSTLYTVKAFCNGTLWSAAYTSDGNATNDEVVAGLVAELTPSPWASLTSYPSQARVTHDTGKLYEATIGGTSGGAATPATVTSAVGPFDFRPAATGMMINQLAVQFNAGGEQDFNVTANRAIKAGTGATGNYPVTGTFSVTVPGFPAAQLVTVTAAANASAMAAQIAPQIIGGFPVVNGTEVDLSPDVAGSTSAISISGTACLGFTNGPGSLAGGSTVANNATVTATELAAIITATIDANGSAAAVGGALVLTSTTTGTSGTATVLVGSTADVIMGGEFATNVVKHGLAAGAGSGPTGTGSAIPDGSVTWKYVVTPNFSAAATGSGGSHVLTATGTAPGDWFALEPIASTDTAAVSNLMALTDTTDDPSGHVSGDLDAILQANQTWYAFTLLFKSADIVAGAPDDIGPNGCSTWAQANKRLLLVTTADTACPTTANSSGTDMLHYLAEGGQSYVAGMWHPRDWQMFDAAKDGFFLPLAPGSDNWRLKSYAGVTPVNFTQTQYQNLIDRRAALYWTVGGRFVDLGNGQVEDPVFGFINLRRNADWYATNLQADLIDALIENNILPHTNAGLQIIRQIIDTRNQLAIKAGVMSPDPLDPANGINQPYLIVVPLSTDPGTFNPDTGALSGISTTFKFGRGINSITVQVNIS